jgi:phosphoribosylanthranilate isomerase
VFVKICGITNEEDALLAVALGADALSFMFVPGSPRQVSPADVSAILRRLPATITTFGVFRDERPERVIEIVNSLGLGGAQLHGREPPSEVRAVKDMVPLVIQAFAAGDPTLASVREGGADFVMIDAAEPGSGRTFDWALAEGAPAGIRLILAGGLTPENVAGAIMRVRPFGVDVSTGVETAPGSGRKDPAKMRRFLEAARAAAEELGDDAWNPDDGLRPFNWQVDERPA